MRGTDGMWNQELCGASQSGCPSTSHPSPTSSVDAANSETITGVPQACASMVGIPKPSP